MNKKDFINLLNLEEFEALKLFERFNLARTKIFQYLLMSFIIQMYGALFKK